MNRPIITILLTASCSLLFSHQAIASRPAMEEVTATGNTAEATVADTQADAPSSVDIIMQQETRQSGDVLQLPAKEIQPGDVIKIKLLDFPRRGMSMDKVRNEYGQPLSVSDSVGEPPITRWIYNDRVVFFEYSTVLHVVAR